MSNVRELPGCVEATLVAVGAEQREVSRTEDNLKMALRFERAWKKYEAAQSIGHDQWRVAKNDFRNGWLAAYEDVHETMRRDNGGCAR
jgi:hypothetical protein